MAWDPTGSGKTSVRLGAGLYYNEILGQIWQFFAVANPQYGIRLVLTPAQGGTFPPAPGATLTTSSAKQTVGAIQFHLPTPTVVHYSLELQRQLQPTVSLRLGYIGSYGYNLARLIEADTRVPQIRSDGSYFFAANAPLINPNFALVRQLRDDSHLQLQRLSSGSPKNTLSRIRVTSELLF